MDKSIIRRKEKDRIRYLKNREERMKKQKEYSKENPLKIKSNSIKQWKRIKSDPERLSKNREKNKRFRIKRRMEILYQYSGGLMKCNCCGEATIEFLAIDHINNNGYEHRKIVKGSDLYRWLRSNNYPEGFQVLCHNCNFAKGVYKLCPHQREKSPCTLKPKK